VGRSLLDAQRVVETERQFVYTRRGPIVPQTTTRTILATENGTPKLLLGALGFKFNPSGRLLFSANVLISLSKDNGLQDMVTPVIQLDYNF
jgi:hypothetical protein